MTIKLSYSSGNIIKSCKRKYYHKVHNTPIDSDAKVETAAFRTGTAFHLGCELTEHFTKTYSDMDLVQLASHCCNEVFKEESTIEIEASMYAMLRSYKQLQSKTQLKCIACEYKIETDTFLGYIDCIHVDVSGGWWITDLKTASKVMPSLFPSLRRNVQLHLYAHFIPTICEAFGLKAINFMGLRYRVVCKPSVRKNSKESLEQYADRANPITWDYAFKPTQDIIDAIWGTHMNLQKEADAIASSNEKPPCNFASCFEYFSPCVYYSQCYSATYSECSSENVMTNETATLICDL
jgi:hypothetical protein